MEYALYNNQCLVVQDTRSIDDDFYRMCYMLGIKENNTLKFYQPFTDMF